MCFSTFFLELIQYLFVGFVDDLGFQRGDVDSGSPFGLVPHGFADDGQGDAFIVGDACPRMAGYVCGERQSQADVASQVFQVAVDECQCFVALLGDVPVGLTDDGKKIRRGDG